MSKAEIVLLKEWVLGKISAGICISLMSNFPTNFFLSIFTVKIDQYPRKLGYSSNADFVEKVRCTFDKVIERIHELNQFKTLDFDRNVFKPRIEKKKMRCFYILRQYSIRLLRLEQYLLIWWKLSSNKSSKMTVPVNFRIINHSALIQWSLCSW